jgi:hypothetical protein
MRTKLHRLLLRACCAGLLSGLSCGALLGTGRYVETIYRLQHASPQEVYCASTLLARAHMGLILLPILGAITGVIIGLCLVLIVVIVRAFIGARRLP